MSETLLRDLRDALEDAWSATSGIDGHTYCFKCGHARPGHHPECLISRSAALSATPAVEQGGAWQPIETAPPVWTIALVVEPPATPEDVERYEVACLQPNGKWFTCDGYVRATHWRTDCLHLPTVARPDPRDGVVDADGTDSRAQEQRALAAEAELAALKARMDHDDPVNTKALAVLLVEIRKLNYEGQASRILRALVGADAEDTRT